MNHFCTKCGYARRQGAKFCAECGNDFDRAQPVSPPHVYNGLYPQMGWQQPVEKSKRSLYDKIYRSPGGIIFITVLCIVIGIPTFILATIFMDDADGFSAFLNIFSLLALFALIIFVPVIVKHRKLLKTAVLKTRVVLRDKEQFAYHVPRGGTAVRQIFNFELPDGGVKSVLLRPSHIRAGGIFDLSVAGDNGTLVYQEWDGRTRLIDFENDNLSLKSKRGLYDKIHNTQNGYVFSMLSIIFSGFTIFIGSVSLLAYPGEESVSAGFYAGMTLLTVLPAALIGYICVPRLYVHVKLKNKTGKESRVKETRVRVRVIDKGIFGKTATDNTRRVLVFKLPDKSRMSLFVRNREAYFAVGVDDTGFLTYREFRGETMFVGFERDIEAGG